MEVKQEIFIKRKIEFSNSGPEKEHWVSSQRAIKNDRKEKGAGP